MLSALLFNIKLLHNLFFNSELRTVAANINRAFYFNLDGSIIRGYSHNEYMSAFLAISSGLQARFEKLDIIDDHEIYAMFQSVCDNAPADSYYNPRYLKQFANDVKLFIEKERKLRVRSKRYQAARLVGGKLRSVTCFDSEKAAKIVVNLILEITNHDYDDYMTIFSYDFRSKCKCESGNDKVTETVRLLFATLKGRYFSLGRTDSCCCRLTRLTRTALQKPTKESSTNSNMPMFSRIRRALRDKFRKKNRLIEPNEYCKPQCAGKMSKYLKQVMYFAVDPNYEAFRQPDSLITTLNEYAHFNQSPNNVIIINIDLNDLIMRGLTQLNSTKNFSSNSFLSIASLNDTCHGEASLLFRNFLLFVEQLVNYHRQSNYFILVLKDFCAPEQINSSNAIGKYYTASQLKDIYKSLKQKIKALCNAKPKMNNVLFFNYKDFNYEQALSQICRSSRFFVKNKCGDTCICD